MSSRMMVTLIFLETTKIRYIFVPIIVEIRISNICRRSVLLTTCYFLVGNVYAQFREEEYTAKVLKNLTGRYYACMGFFSLYVITSTFAESIYKVWATNPNLTLFLTVK